MNFRSLLSELSIEATDELLGRFEKYYEMLIDWNSRINLTAITDHDEVYIKHFYDSLLMTKAADIQKIDSVCDIGSGAGFPSLPLKLAFPHLKVTIIEPTQKRTRFLEETVKALDLHDVTIKTQRAEDLANSLREQFDIVTARAVARLDMLLELSMSYVKINGCFIAYKGMDCSHELDEARLAVGVLGGKIEDVFKTVLPLDYGGRSLIIIRKIKKTPSEYPRAFAKMKSKPLSNGGEQDGKNNSHR